MKYFLISLQDFGKITYLGKKKSRYPVTLRNNILSYVYHAHFVMYRSIIITLYSCGFNYTFSSMHSLYCTVYSVHTASWAAQGTITLRVLLVLFWKVEGYYYIIIIICYLVQVPNKIIFEVDKLNGLMLTFVHCPLGLLVLCLSVLLVLYGLCRSCAPFTTNWFAHVLNKIIQK